MSRNSVESFRADCISYLGDRSNLSTATLKGADWQAVYDDFHNRPETTDADLEAAAEALRKVSPLTVPEQSATVDVEETEVEETGAVVFASDVKLGGNLAQVVLALAALAEQGRAVRIESGLFAGHEDLLLAAAPLLAQWHRNQVGERVSAGLAAASAQGRKGGRPKALDDATRAALVARVDGGETVTEAAKALGISRATAYRMLPKAN